MSEKEKMQTEELAKIMDDAKPLGKSALSFMAGFVQGYKEAQSADPAENTGRKEGNEDGGRSGSCLSPSFREARPVRAF